MTTQVLTTEETGNTKTVSSSRSYQFTIHQLDKAPEIITHFKNLKSCDYGLAGFELCPTTQKPHIHLYVHLTKPYRLPKKILDYLLTNSQK